MEIKVRLQLLDSDDCKGVKLWATAQDGSTRRWFKRYENADIAVLDAEYMHLVEHIQFSPSQSRYAQNVHRKLYDEVDIAEEVLNKEWHLAER